jgi:hypothetical protein
MSQSSNFLLFFPILFFFQFNYLRLKLIFYVWKLDIILTLYHDVCFKVFLLYNLNIWNNFDFIKVFLFNCRFLVVKLQVTIIGGFIELRFICIIDCSQIIILIFSFLLLFVHLYRINVFFFILFSWVYHFIFQSLISFKWSCFFAFIIYRLSAFKV